MVLKSIIKGNPFLKKIAHRIIIPKGKKQPRSFIKYLVNPFVHKRGRRSKICRSVRRDLFPFRKFILGNNAVIEDFSTLNNGVGDLIIGNNSRVGIGNVLIGPVEIGNNCILAQNIVISGLNHGYEDPLIPIKDQPVMTKPISIKNDCWIGANVCITAGVEIGEHSIIGAGSVVTKSIPPFHVAVGNPAKLVKKYDFEARTWVKIQKEQKGSTFTPVLSVIPNKKAV